MTRFHQQLQVPSTKIIPCCLILLLTWTLASHAQSQPEESTVLSALKFTTGVICGYALHETGHALAAKLTNTDMDWGIGTYNQPLGFTEKADNDTDGIIVHSAGLITQIFNSEVILQSDSIDKNDTFVRGMMAWNIINPILYALDYWFINATNKTDGNRYQGDITGVEHYSDTTTANLFAATMAGLAAWQGYRFLKTQDWAPHWIKSEKVNLNCRPLPRAGVQLTFEIPF